MDDICSEWPATSKRVKNRFRPWIFENVNAVLLIRSFKRRDLQKYLWGPDPKFFWKSEFWIWIADEQNFLRNAKRVSIYLFRLPLSEKNDWELRPAGIREVLYQLNRCLFFKPSLTMGLTKTVAFSNLFWRFLRNRRKKNYTTLFPYETDGSVN